MSWTASTRRAHREETRLSMKGLQSVMMLLGLALVAVAPCQAQITGSDFPIPSIARGTFNVAQVYPSSIAGYPGAGISDSQTWGGSCGTEPLTQSAAPGILSLRRT